MNIGPNTPRGDYTCAGVTLQFPSPFAAGHQLTEAEADVLNQTTRENLRNNFAAKARAMAEEKKPIAEIQKEFDAYCQVYEFGVRRGGGGGRTGDPIEAASIEIATEIVKKALREKGQKLKEIGSKEIRRLALEAIEKYPKIRVKAEELVKIRQSALDIA